MQGKGRENGNKRARCFRGLENNNDRAPLFLLRTDLGGEIRMGPCEGWAFHVFLC